MNGSSEGTHKLFSIESGVYVIFFQACITGVLIGTLLFSISLLFHWPAWIISSFGVTGGTLLSWLFYRGAWMRTVNALVGVPAAPPPAEQEPQEPQEYNYTLKVPIVSPDGRSGQFATFPASPRQMKYLGVQMMKPGATFSENYLCGEVITRKELAKIRAEMLSRGLAVWKSPRDTARGIILTSGGNSCMKFFAGMTPEDIEPIQ